jgi:hypothetical protein
MISGKLVGVKRATWIYFTHQSAEEASSVNAPGGSTQRSLFHVVFHDHV